MSCHSVTDSAISSRLTSFVDNGHGGESQSRVLLKRLLFVFVKSSFHVSPISALNILEPTKEERSCLSICVKKKRKKLEGILAII